MRYAAIDIGTNSIHLAIAEVDDEHQIHVLDTHKQSVRLGTHIDDHKMIDEAGIEKTIAALSAMKSICDSYHLTPLIVATQAVRAAKNQSELISRVFAKIGVQINVIDGLEEARLIHLGVGSGLAKTKPMVCIDVGGGSTEVIWGTGDSIEKALSLKVGAVMLTERFGGDWGKIRAHIHSRVLPLVDERPPGAFEQAVASSGTAKATAMMIAKMRQRKIEDIHDFSFSLAELNSLEVELGKDQDPESLCREYGIDMDRAEIMPAGVAILAAIGRLFGLEKWKVSSLGLREGVILDEHYKAQPLKPGHVFSELRWRSIRSMMKKFRVDKDFAKGVAEIAMGLYEDLQPALFPEAEEDLDHENRELLKAGAMLLEVGKFIAFTKYHKHSQYIIERSHIMGFSEREKHLIGGMVRYCRKSVLRKDKLKHDAYLKAEATRVNKLAGVLRLARSLSRSRRALIGSISAKIEGGKLVVNGYCPSEEPTAEIVVVNRERDPLFKQIGFEVELRIRSS